MISVIIPAHNEEQYIAKTLESVEGAKGCTGAEVETIVVCNACTDNTAYVCHQFPVTIIETGHRGVSYARNLGAKQARFDMLVFLDADTLLDSDILQHILNSGLKLGSCKAKPDKERWIYKKIYSFKNRLLHKGYYFGLIFCTKELFEKAGGFNEELNCMEGRDFNKKAMQYAKFGVVNSAVTNSMRRYERLGVLNCSLFWLRKIFGGSKGEYPVVR